MNIYTPTYLYVKQHSVTGLKYFGKTTRDPIKYIGSGKYWLPHIKKHGKEHVVTLWSQLFDDKDLLTEFALLFSEHWDIVKSDKWANLIPENGLNGGSLKGRIVSEETRQKISENSGSRLPEVRNKISVANTGKRATTQTKEKMSKSRIGKIHTEDSISLMRESKYGSTHTEEAKLKMSKSHKGKILTPEHIANRTNSQTGAKRSPETCSNISKSLIGKPRSQEALENHAIAMSKRIGKELSKVECPHCSKIGGGGAMIQHHFDRCKLKP